MGLIQTSVKQSLKILDFDIENRPLSYMGNDYTTAEITAIACSWVGEDHVDCWLLGEIDPDLMLMCFVNMYNQADMVTGHYIRKHDLPIINGALLEYELPPLSAKLTQDTKMDLVKKKELSASQESLSSMYNLPEAKHHMDQPSWREANRLTEKGLSLTRKRVIDDVKQHKELRLKLIENKALGMPKLWKPV